MPAHHIVFGFNLPTQALILCVGRHAYYIEGGIGGRIIRVKADYPANSIPARKHMLSQGLVKNHGGGRRSAVLFLKDTSTQQRNAQHRKVIRRDRSPSDDSAYTLVW